MGFKKQERYWLRRLIAGRWWYLNANGEPTRAPKLFGENWSNGDPVALTYTQALKLQATERGQGYRVDLAAGGWND